MSKRFYQPELDGLRFFAFCLVFIHHIEGNGGHWRNVLRDFGSFGMSLFFLLSAFLIVTLLLREDAATGSIDVRSFFVRRILRIWPLYFLIILCAGILGHAYPPAKIGGHVLVAFSVMLTNVYVLSHGWVNLRWAAPMWSISVEEQFYLVVPLTVRRLNRRALAIACAAVIGMSYVVLIRLSLQSVVTLMKMWPNSFVQFQFFAAGGLLALWMEGREFSINRLKRVVMITMGSLLWLCAAMFCGMQSLVVVAPWRPPLGYFLVLVGTTSILLGVFNAGWKVPRLIAYLGKISFGLYMFHNFFLWIFTYRIVLGYVHALRPFVAAIATVCAATLSYRYIEQPFLTLKYRFERIHSRPA